MPRYDHAVLIDSVRFDDPLFGSPYDHATTKEVPLELRTRITAEIKANLVLAGA